MKICCLFSAAFQQHPTCTTFSASLRARNFKIALISSGIPTVIVEKLSTALGADYAFGVEVETIDGKLTGEIWGDAITRNGKLKILNEILKKENLVAQRLRCCC